LRGRATAGTCSYGQGRRESETERTTRAILNRIVPLDVKIDYLQSLWDRIASDS